MGQWLAGLLAACAALAIGCDEGALLYSGGTLRRASDPWVHALAPGGTQSAAPAERSVSGGPGADPVPCSLAAAGEQQPITVARLLADMVDLQRLTQRPAPTYVSRMASSHNRKSDRAPRGSKQWFANKDHVSVEDGETRTLLHVRGPGALTRIWSASPAGILRIYLDGAAKPAVEANLAELLSGGVPPFDPPFAFVAEGGHNLYFPIPFARSCRVTLSGEASQVFFHIAYREYARGARVQTFAPAALLDARCVQALVSARLTALRADSDAVDSGTRVRARLDAHDARSQLTMVAGAIGGMLWQLRVTPDARSAQALRATVLSIRFDGVETVRAPLGDFFGSGFGLHEVSSLPAGVTDGGVLTARWPMPFQHEAQIALRAAGPAATSASVEVVSSEHAWTDQSLLLHAQWRAPQTFPSKPPRDFNVATIRGEGVYVGNVLNVINRNTQWWGEGDEKIYVDGEAFPSHFGTGTEDYYGYAWCSNQPFTTAFVGHPLSTPRRSFGPLSLYRFHVPDPISFRTGLRFDLEVRHWGDPVDVTYDALSFWYARPGSVLEGAASDPALFRVPQLDVPEPTDVKVAPYRCGG